MPIERALHESRTWKKVMAFGSDQAEIAFRAAAVTVVVVGLYASSLYSYILFHSLIEITTIAIGFTLFTLTLNARHFLTGGCLKTLGIGYGLIALVDLLHSLAYKGMGVFPGYGANLPTQLWIAARSLQALLLCLAPLLARRNLDERVLFGISLAAVSASTALVYSGVFPDCFIEGTGLTPFKIVSEYVISALLLVALLLFIGKRAAFNSRVFTFIVVSILCTIASELAFTSYVSVYGPANMVGHFLKLAAFYLIYRALVVTGFQDPFNLIFRDLKQAEQALNNANEELEQRVEERTEELRSSEERYRMVFEDSPVSIWEEDFSGVRTFFDGLKKEGVTDIEQYFDLHPDAVRHCAELAKVIDVNRAVLALHEAASKEDLFVGLVNTFTPESFDTFRQELVCLWNGGTEMVRDAVVKTLAGEPRHVTVYFSVCPGYEASLAKILVSLADITERKRAEETLHLQTVELEEEVAERQMTQENLQEKAILLEEEIEKRQKSQVELEQLNTTLEQRVKERTAELEAKNIDLNKLNRLFVGRELKMVELKERIRVLEERDRADAKGASTPT